MGISENIIDRRKYLVEWLKPELKGIPVTVTEEDDSIYIRFQDLLICGVQVEEEFYKIYNATEDWKKSISYPCEKAEDGSYFYYVDSVDECISQCKGLVVFEAKKNSKKSSATLDAYDEKSALDAMQLKLDEVKREYMAFGYDRRKHRQRDPEMFDITYANKVIGELWPNEEGPHLWTNAVSEKDKKSASFMKRGKNIREPDILYLKESNSDKGNHYTMLLSSFDRIPEVMIHMIKVVKGEE